MALFPDAKWRGPVPWINSGQMQHPVQGLVLHIQEGYEDGTDATFHDVNAPPDKRVSAHFGCPKNVGLDQWVDTNDKAWAIVAGNRHWISVENEGFTGDSLTPNQIENCAKLLAWLNATDGVPLVATDDPAGRGLGWHGMGGDAWGGHFDCPGKPIVSQRPAIIARAQQLVDAAKTSTGP